MHTVPYSRFHRHTTRPETSIRSAFVAAGSVLFTVLTILILFFVVFLERTR